jgi:CO/xanthine dehydrogenase Mo-binding subunit
MDSPELVPVVVDQVDEFSNNSGVKGMAEPPCIPTAPAILNAVYNATGVMVRQFPLTPEHVLKALKEAEKS